DLERERLRDVDGETFFGRHEVAVRQDLVALIVLDRHISICAYPDGIPGLLDFSLVVTVDQREHHVDLIDALNDALTPDLWNKRRQVVGHLMAPLAGGEPRAGHPSP